MFLLRSVVLAQFIQSSESKLFFEFFKSQVLEMLRTSFGQRARSASSSGISEALDDCAVAGLSLVEGYFKSVMASDTQCAQRALCESNQAAIREGREFGHIVAQLGSYASSYFLQKQKLTPFNESYEAARKGRSGEDCAKLYSKCNESNEKIKN